MEAIREAKAIGSQGNLGAKAIWEPRQYNPWPVKPSQGQVEVLKCHGEEQERVTRRNIKEDQERGLISAASVWFVLER